MVFFIGLLKTSHDPFIYIHKRL